MKTRKNQKGSIELIVLALLAALIVVLAMPLLQGIGQQSKNSLEIVNKALTNANNTIANNLGS